MARHGTWTETGGGGGDWSLLAGGVVALVVAAVALRIGAAVASTVATILITLFWVAAGLITVLLGIVVAYIAVRLHRGLGVPRPRSLLVNHYQPRPLGQRGHTTVIRQGQPLRIEPPPLAAITDDALAAEIRRRIGERH